MKQAELVEKTENLMRLKDIESSTKKELTPLKDELKSYVSENGEDTENAKVIEVKTEKGIVLLKNIKKRSTSIKHTALDYIKTNLSKRQQLKLIESIEVVREDILIQMLGEDTFTPDQVDNIFNVEITESFTPKYKK